MSGDPAVTWDGDGWGDVEALSHLKKRRRKRRKSRRDFVRLQLQYSATLRYTRRMKGK